jgi:hypothetical protein
MKTTHLKHFVAGAAVVSITKKVVFNGRARVRALPFKGLGSYLLPQLTWIWSP